MYKLQVLCGGQNSMNYSGSQMGIKPQRDKRQKTCLETCNVGHFNLKNKLNTLANIFLLWVEKWLYEVVFKLLVLSDIWFAVSITTWSKNRSKWHWALQWHQMAAETTPTSTLSKLKSNSRWDFLSHTSTYDGCVFLLLWNDCCCIYKRPAINSSTGKLVTTNGWRNKKKSPL